VVVYGGGNSAMDAARTVPGIEIEDHVVKVGANMMTGHAGIFAGGDMVPAERTVTVGIGHGKKAARHIDAWLRGTEPVTPQRHELATFDKLNTWYYSDALATVRPQLAAARRRSTFGPSTLGTAWRDGQTCRMHTADRFFSIVDPSSRRLVGLCTGPDDDGSCPTTAEGALPCEGRQVIPLRGTPVDGLPFTVTAAPSPVCPLAWIDSASSPKVR
jgi:hypothetical protein